jgi:hypothetical protein
LSPSVSVAMPQLGQITRNGWWLLGGAILVFIGSLLPWSEASVEGVGLTSSHPGGGGVLIFLVLAVGAVAAAWPLLTGVLSRRRLLIATVPVALLTLFSLTNWSDLGKVEQEASGGFVHVSAGSGLVLYTLGVVALCVLIVRLWLFGRRASQIGASS